MKLDFQHIDELAQLDSMIHRRHPLSKVLVTLFFIIGVTTQDKYGMLRLLPFFFYPMVLFILSDLPMKRLMKIGLPGLFFVVMLGIFNPILEQSQIQVSDTLFISSGWLSFGTLLLKGVLTILAALLLIGTTGMAGVSRALILLRFPRVFVLQLSMTYRYMSLLMEEAVKTQQAFALRSCGIKRVSIKVFGSMVGQLLIRTYDRGSQVYQAMNLRGYRPMEEKVSFEDFHWQDGSYILVMGLFIFALTFFDGVGFLGEVILGGQR